jgi:hypothetical protein
MGMAKFRLIWLGSTALSVFILNTAPVLAQNLPTSATPTSPVRTNEAAAGSQNPSPAINLTEIGSLPSGATRIRTIRVGTPEAPKTLRLGDFTLDVAKINAPDNPIVARFAKLQKLGSLITVKPVETSIDELSTGVLIKQMLRYDLRLGACRGAGAQLAEAGVACGTASTLAQRVQAISNPADLDNYVADPAERRDAIAALTGSADELHTEVRKTREYLATPAAAAALGAEEIARLSALSDDALIAEVMDSGETEIAQGIFLPAMDRIEIFKKLPVLGLQPYNISPQALQAVLNYSQAQATQGQDSAPSPTPSSPAQSAQAPALPPKSVIVGSDKFLAGFTLGKEYEWRWRIQKTVKWCIWGCKSTYFIEPYASLGFGLGLRFPITTSLLATRNDTGDALTVKPTITAFNGDEEDYRATGLERGKLFDGKELVAEYSYRAGIRYSLPRHRGNWSIGDAYDFTEALPRPFTNGQFRPPSPGRDLMTFQKVFTEVDLLGRQADYGIVSAALYPAVKVNLSSDELSMRLVDATPGGTSERRLSSGELYPVKINSRGNASVKMGQPKYNLSFKITPGLNYLLKVDLAVWSKRWTDTIWIPDLEIQLPPGGVDFGCHAGTICERTYNFGGYVPPASSSGSSGSTASTTGQRQRGTPSGAPLQPSPSQQTCNSQQIAGRWAFRDLASQRFVRGGVSGEGQNDLVGLGSADYAANPARDWATFEIYEISGVPGGRRLRNTIDGRWLETKNDTNTLLLPQGRTCSVSNQDMQWQVEPASNGYLLRNTRTGKYVRLDGSGLLKADAEKAQATKFGLGNY